MRNEAGLVIGATVRPSQTRYFCHSADADLQIKSRTGVEFDHRLNTNERLGVLAGVDFVASPLDVKLDQRTANVVPEYAYVFPLEFGGVSTPERSIESGKHRSVLALEVRDFYSGQPNYTKNWGKV
jgi:hypothetical protein